jgi:Ca-activated chloride channel family protein
MPRASLAGLYPFASLSAVIALQFLLAGCGPTVGLMYGPLFDSHWIPPTGEGIVVEESEREEYEKIHENRFLNVTEAPLSTFAVDVDTASYSNVRRFLTQDRLPPADAVRIEEMINYFDYSDPAPTGDAPFGLTAEVAECPWKPEHRLVRFAVRGRDIEVATRPASNLVFLIDVSGSMAGADKLPLVKNCLQNLVEELDERDHIAIVTYAGKSGVALRSTSADQKETILAAIESLSTGGNTHGSAGIETAYSIAVENFIEEGVNRVVLCTDGDFNVGITDRDELIDFIQEQANSDVFLSVLGFGTGNLNDSTMEALADKGNGNYAYIDKLSEGRKVLIEQLTGTLITIASDVKVQIEFNPAHVAGYRLIGYENRVMAAEDFDDDEKDAGEIGAGHTVTALYQLVPAGQSVPNTSSTELRYQTSGELTASAFTDELCMFHLRYKEPGADSSQEIVSPVRDLQVEFSKASENLRFSASVAAFGMLLRGSQHVGDADYSDVMDWAEGSIGEDRMGYRQEFLELVEAASELGESQLATR